MDAVRHLPFIGSPFSSGFPALTLANSYGYLASYLAPSNNITDISKGVELSLDFGRINSIRTSFTLNGAYMSNLFYENGPTFYNRDSGLTDQFHVGIYEGESEKLHRERLVTTLRATHNIPRIGLVITLTAQVTWMEKEWSSFGNDSIPIGYLDVFDHGARAAFSMSDSEKLTPGTQEYKAMEAILKTTYDYRYRVERRPPLLLMNINVTKSSKESPGFIFRQQHVHELPGLQIARQSGRTIRAIRTFSSGSNWSQSLSNPTRKP
ncbi:MAG: hypothetical protein ACLR8Y_19550 [Alistipes indistinctus]